MTKKNKMTAQVTVKSTMLYMYKALIFYPYHDKTTLLEMISASKQDIRM
jgi:hypothetical protein